MKTKEPFAIVWKSELQFDLKPGEFKVYLTIKSFSSNARLEVALSTREIAERANLSQSYVLEIIFILIEKKVIEIVGKETRVGGSVNVYKVNIPTISKRTLPLSLDENKVNAIAWKSERRAEKSEHSSGTNLQQSNKVIKESNGISKDSISKPNNESSPLEEKSSQSPTTQGLPKDFFDKTLDLAEKLSAKKVEEERRAR